MHHRPFIIIITAHLWAAVHSGPLQGREQRPRTFFPAPRAMCSAAPVAWPGSQDPYTASGVVHNVHIMSKFLWPITKRLSIQSKERSETIKIIFADHERGFSENNWSGNCHQPHIGVWYMIFLLSLLTCFMTSPPTPDAPPNAGHATRCQPRNFIIRNIKLYRGTLWLLTSVTAEMMHSLRVNTALKHFLGHLFYVSDKKTRKLL